MAFTLTLPFVDGASNVHDALPPESGASPSSVLPEKNCTDPLVGAPVGDVTVAVTVIDEPGVAVAGPVRVVVVAVTGAAVTLNLRVTGAAAFQSAFPSGPRSPCRCRCL